MSTSAIRLALAVAATAIGASGITACSSSAHATTGISTPRSHAAAAPKRTTLEFLAHDEPGNMTLDDLGAKSAPGGPDIGDLLAFTQTLTRDGKPAGQVHVTAVGVDRGTGTSVRPPAPSRSATAGLRSPASSRSEQETSPSPSPAAPEQQDRHP